MNYTFYPLEIIDTVNSHTGFYLFGIIAGCLLILGSAAYGRPEDRSSLVTWCSIILGALGLIGYVSYTTGEIVVPKNTQVIGTLHAFYAEGFNEEIRSVKSVKRQDVHFSYVVYEVNGNLVMFRSTPGTEYPKRAILYAN